MWRKGRLVAWTDFHKDPQAAVQAPIQIWCQNEPVEVIKYIQGSSWWHVSLDMISRKLIVHFCCTLNIHRSRRCSWRTLNEPKKTSWLSLIACVCHINRSVHAWRLLRIQVTLALGNEMLSGSTTKCRAVKWEKEKKKCKGGFTAGMWITWVIFPDLSVSW